MQGAIVEELVVDDGSGRPVLASEIGQIVDKICESDAQSKWLKGVELNLGSKRWRPSATTAGSDRLLYVCMDEEVPRFVAERIKLAKAGGIGITVALPISSLFVPEFVEFLVGVDSNVYVVDDYQKERRFQQRHFLAALADVEVPLSFELRRMIGQAVWSQINDGSSQDKGRRLEALLSFLFSQAKDLKVVERNYRNETEEIDLVLQVNNSSTRSWQCPGVPFILVEAKNRVDKASQQMMSVMLTKLQTKRGSARIGIMVSPAGFTEDAKMQELRFSTQDICVVMIGRPGLEALLIAEDIDEQLESMVRHALLR